MTPYYADAWLTVYQGDALTVLRDLPSESVHCVVTSPPYWGLRDYGTAAWEGGDAACDHQKDRTLGIASSGLEGGKATTNHQHEAAYRATCGKCGARRIDSQLGLEPTPDAYVAAMVGVFREVRRVLRADGTLWLNIGDSYIGGKGQNGTSKALGNAAERGYVQSGGTLVSSLRPQDRIPDGLKPKDLVGIPWRLAFALQADGWYLRSDIIWAKPNPMPESVTDRPTKSHEYLFLLSKSARYFYDADAVREPHVRIWDPSAPNGSINARTRDATGIEPNPAGRNLRSVWTIATEPYPGAHFATFPRKLVEPCIKAGCPADGTVLDPFAGTGTVGLVAQALSRRAVLIDLSMDYLGQLLHRNRQTPLGLPA